MDLTEDRDLPKPQQVAVPEATTATATFTVQNDKGLHTRPSTELVKVTSGYKSHVRLIYQENAVNAKSLLGILMLAAGRGSKIQVEATGPDAQAAVDAVLALALAKFNIRY
jgi:phosphocarrier protein HPr